MRSVLRFMLGHSSPAARAFCRPARARIVLAYLPSGKAACRADEPKA
jgi:hypothetical protein